MTNKEAIELIKLAQAEVEWNYPMDYAVAFDKAIEALEKQEAKKYFLYVTYTLSGFKVYSVETDDIFHAMGELYYRSIEQIDRVDYREYTDELLEYWNREGQSIIEFKEKYSTTNEEKRNENSSNV